MPGLREAPAPYRPARLDKKALLALMEAGVLEDRRIEMMDGVLIEMSPVYNRQGKAVFMLVSAFAKALPSNLQGVTDGSLFLGTDHMVGPDISILPDDILIQDARSDELTLVVEVSDTSLDHDLGDKKSLYERYGVREYWVVDLPNRKLHIHKQPNNEGFGHPLILDWSETARSERIPGLAITLSELLDR